MNLRLSVGKCDNESCRQPECSVHRVVIRVLCNNYQKHQMKMERFL